MRIKVWLKSRSRLLSEIVLECILVWWILLSRLKPKSFAPAPHFSSTSPPCLETACCEIRRTPQQSQRLQCPEEPNQRPKYPWSALRELFSVIFGTPKSKPSQQESCFFGKISPQKLGVCFCGPGKCFFLIGPCCYLI